MPGQDRIVNIVSGVFGVSAAAVSWASDVPQAPVLDDLLALRMTGYLFGGAVGGVLFRLTSKRDRWALLIIVLAAIALFFSLNAYDQYRLNIENNIDLTCALFVACNAILIVLLVYAAPTFKVLAEMTGISKPAGEK